MVKAIDDATVKSGSNASKNYGSREALWSKNKAANPNARNVSFMKFDLGNIETSKISQAILRVRGEDPLSTAGVISHVYGIMDDTWNENSIAWNTAPNLCESLGTVHSIKDNFIEGIGTSAKFLGHLTSSPTEELLQLDVTNFLRDHGDQLVSLLVTREVRWNGEDVDDDLGSLRMVSKEHPGGTGPKLVLFLDPLKAPGNHEKGGNK